MIRQAALAGALLRRLGRNPCQRLLSTSPSSAPSCQARRPTFQAVIRPKTWQPMTQRGYAWKTMEQAKSQYRLGPVSWRSVVVFAITAAGLVWYFDHEKERMKRKRIAESTKGVGKAQVGGPFELIDQYGNTMSSEDLKGRYTLMYFGFSHCPDICPEELDKMAAMIDKVDRARPGALIPVFVTCDPARDPPEVLREYLAEFHPRLVGLTGTYEQIKAMCKTFRVYFSTPTDMKPGQDYLVDHSIYFYLMDPDGDFVECLGRQHSPDEGAKVILDHMKEWRGQWSRQ